MVIPRWHEFGFFPSFRQLREEMDRVLREFEFPRFAPVAETFPAMNVYSGPEEVVVVAEVPGIPATALDLSITADTLTLRGKRGPEEPEVEERQVHRRERPHGEFVRMITLPEQVDASQASAECRNGLLTVRVPKAPESRPRQIPVKVT